MKRLTEAWFEFRGRRSDEMGVMIKQMPVRSVGARRTERKNVSGRDGTLAYGGGEYKDAKVRLEFDLRDETRLAEVMGWLNGSGRLRFSDEAEYEYQASIESEFSRSSIQPRLSGQRFSVTWTCAPFRYHHLDDEDGDNFAIAESGEMFYNPGTAPSLPRVEIRGSGDFSLNIGGQTARFSGVDGNGPAGSGIIIDSELGDALTLDGAQLANHKMDGELFKIQPGLNAVSWATGGEDDEGNPTQGRVESVIITPRWRYL